MLSAALRKSVTDLTRRRARAAFTVATLALAVASVGIFALPPLMDRAMQDEIAANRLADVTLEMQPTPLREADLVALTRLPGVAEVQAWSEFRTRVYVGERRAKALVIGVHDFADQDVDVVRVSAGSPPAEAGTVLTDVQNARRDQYEGRTGDVLRVVAADGSVRPLRVSGEARNLVGGQEVGAESTVVLYATPPTVSALGGESGYRSLHLRLTDAGSAALERTLAGVRRRLGAGPAFAGFTDLPEVRAQGDWPGKQELEDFSTLFFIVTVLALLSALVLISSTMATLVGEQSGEIATMKAVGARRRQIIAIYIRTALMLGAVGTVAGSVLGIVLASVLVDFFGTRFFAIEPGFAVEAPIVAAGIVVGLAGPPLAALPAIRRGTRVTVREALQASASMAAPGRLDAVLRRATWLPRTAQIGFRDVTRRTRRSVATVLQVALAVGTMLGVLGLGSGIAETVHGSWREHGWNIWVAAAGARPFDAAAESLVRSTPGVARIEPIVADDVTFAGEEAFAWGTASDTMFRHRVVSGRWYTGAEDRAAEPVAVVERNLARLTGTSVGETVRMETAGGPVSLRVIGIAANQQEVGTVVFVPRSTARSLAGLGDASDSFWVRTTSPSHEVIDRTASAVEDTLVSHGYGVSTEVTYVGERDDAAAYGTLSTTIAVLGFLIIGISLLGLAGAVTMSVIERTREVGILRCIGARARDIRRIFATEGIVLVAIGWAAGVPLGLAIDHVLVWLVRESIHAEVTFSFPLWHLPLTFAGTIALALLAMVVPLRRAVRLRPGDALRYA